MKKSSIIAILIALSVVLLSSCAHRDCRGNKHRVKVDGGAGYL